MPARKRTTPSKPTVTTRTTARPAAKAPRKPGAAARPAKKAAPPAPAAAVKPAPTKPAKAAPADKPAKPRRVALVRDGFTMPEADFALIAALKARALAAQREVKKSELLRAGLQALAQLDGAALVAALNRLEPVKTGRPKKGH